MSKRTSLTLVMPSNKSPISSTITSPSEPESRSPSPRGQRHAQPQSETRFQRAEAVNGATFSNTQKSGPKPTPASFAEPRSPTLTSLPQIPSSPKNGSKHTREQSKSFFANLKASKSFNRVHQVDPTIRQVSEDTPRIKTATKENTVYSVRKSPGSTPDLSLTAFSRSSPEISDASDPQSDGHSNNRPPAGTSILSDSAIHTNSSEASSGKRNKPRFAQLLTRTRSIKMDDAGGRRSKPPTPSRITVPDDRSHLDAVVGSGGMRTAPLQRDRNQSFPEVGDSTIRNRSADRQTSSKSQPKAQPTLSYSTSTRDPNHGSTPSVTSTPREGSSSHILNNLKNTSHKAAGGLGKAGKGIFNKMTRSGSSSGREVADEDYVFKVINLPLIEQARLTRLAKRLEDSKDKTEFWMPALPWRCIDYLNFRGCDVEGLYRVPGGMLQVREYQRRFDQELDINLFDEKHLYDINIIGSMFKTWLRELPDEILPKATQTRIALECAGATEVPQLLKDELSSLPPWNYYLLFAITCHLSLLHAYVDQNRMDYKNLCICFQPCLRIDGFCFQFLVCDWRNCWQGCWTEKEALAEEYRVLEGLHSSSGDSESANSAAVAEDRPLGSSHGTAVPHGPRANERARPPPLSLTQPSDEHLATPTRGQTGARGGGHLPELAPVMPLSPIGTIGD